MCKYCKNPYPKLGGGDGDLAGGDLCTGGDLDLDLDLEQLLLRLLFLDLRLLGLLDLDLLCEGGEGVRLVYLLFGGDGLFSTGMFTGLGLFDFSLAPIAINSSFSFFAWFLAL